MTATGERVDRADERDQVIGPVDRGEAVTNGWPHRVATTVCRTLTAGSWCTGGRRPGPGSPASTTG
ncbi:hypothetical protein RKD18_003934 [Streptomyces phaeoluteigriseus]